MNRGVKAALLVSGIGLVGCSAGTSKVEVRAIANPSAVLARGGDALAVARGQLMLGNVGLALEGFRKAQRDNPASPAALAGIGDCYAAMSRFDLAQSNYEAALALAPHDRTLLLGLAAIFEREGLPVRAMAVRAEANALAQPAPVATTAVARAESQAAPAVTNVAAKPLARPAPVVTAAVAKPAVPAPVRTIAVTTPAPRTESVVSAAVAKPALQLAPAATSIVAMPAQPSLAVVNAIAKVAAEPLPMPAVAPETAVARVEQPVKMPSPSIGSITVALPAARPVHRLENRAPVLAEAEFDSDPSFSSSITVALPPARPAPAPRPEPAAQALMAEGPAPRLERLTTGEVALVTTGKSLWKGPQNLLAAASSVRWVALARPGTRPNIQILNAARSQGLAASARAVLHDRGWRKLAVGDAPAVQAKSVVLYPKGREKLGKRLAAQFGVAARMVERDILVLVLGRDAVDRVAPQRKS